MIIKIAYVPCTVVCLSQINQFTPSERNLLHVATTDTDVADSVSLIHIVEKLMPRPITHDDTSNITDFVVNCTFIKSSYSFDDKNKPCASGILSRLMMNERDQLFNGILSIVCLAIKPSATAAVINTAQNAYAAGDENTSTLTYVTAPTTMPVNAKSDFTVGNARPRNTYSFNANTTGVTDFTAMNVSNGARFITSIPAKSNKKKLKVSGTNATAICGVNASTSITFVASAMRSMIDVDAN